MNTVQINSLMNDKLIQNIKDRSDYYIAVKPDGLHCYYGGFCAFILELDLKKKMFSGEITKYLKYVPKSEAGERLFSWLSSRTLSSDTIERTFLDDTMRSVLEKTIDNYANGVKVRGPVESKRKPTVLIERTTQQIIARKGIQSNPSQYRVFDLEFAVTLTNSKPECDMAAVIWIDEQPTIGFIEYKCTIAALKKDTPTTKATLRKHWEAMREYINNKELITKAWYRYCAMVNTGLMDCPNKELLDYYSNNINKIKSEALFLFVKINDEIKNYVYRRVKELSISENDNVRFVYFDCIEDIIWDYDAFQKREDFIKRLS